MTRRFVRTAYHEAGHALVAHVLGFQIRSVTIVPTDIPEGILAGCGLIMIPDIKEVAIKAPYRAWRLGIGAGAVLVAGQMTERFWFGTKTNRDTNDYDKAKEYLARANLPGVTILRCEHIACQRLRKHSSAVHALATTLLTRRVIEGERVHRILAEAHPLPWQLSLPFQPPRLLPNADRNPSCLNGCRPTVVSHR